MIFSMSSKALFNGLLSLRVWRTNATSLRSDGVAGRAINFSLASRLKPRCWHFPRNRAQTIHSFPRRRRFRHRIARVNVLIGRSWPRDHGSQCALLTHYITCIFYFSAHVSYLVTLDAFENYSLALFFDSITLSIWRLKFIIFQSSRIFSNETYVFAN